jgi:hypothetical protein
MLVETLLIGALAFELCAPPRTLLRDPDWITCAMTLPSPNYCIAKLRCIQNIKSGMVTALSLELDHRVYGLEPHK